MTRHPGDPPPRTQTPHGSVSHEPSVVTSVSHERSVLTRRARRAHLHLEFSPDHEIAESRSSLGWKGPQSPSHSTPCHGQDTSHHSRRLREAMSVHTSHILWDEGIRETPPGARTPPEPTPSTPRAPPQPPPPPHTALGGQGAPTGPAWAHPRGPASWEFCPSRAPATVLTLAQAQPRPCTQGWAPTVSPSAAGAGRRRAELCWPW